MIPVKHWPIGAAVLLLSVASCNSNETKKEETAVLSQQKIKEEMVSYSSDSVTMNGFVAYDESTDKKKPVVLVVHEWWGLNDYAKSRAKKLAELGYIAMAGDM